MQTAMSEALVKAGLLNEEQSKKVKVVSCHLEPYAGQIQEIDRLAVLLTQNGVELSLIDLGTTRAFQAMFNRGEHIEAYEMLLSHMKKVADQHGLI